MIEILRLSKCIASVPLKKRLMIMESIYNSNPNKYSVHEICEAFEVARGTFYNHIFRRADTSAKESRELQIIIDLYSRKVVGYHVSEQASKQLVSTTLRRALQYRNPPAGLTFHSDRGSQYTAKSFQRLLSDNHILQSLSEKGKPYDNAVAEAFFHRSKKEELYRHDYYSESDFKRSLADYILFYNAARAHAYLNYKSPDEYEALYSKKNDN